MHVLHIRNIFPGQNQNTSPLILVTGCKDNFCNLQEFSCQVWVCSKMMSKRESS